MAQNLQSFFDPHLLEHLLVGERKKPLFRPIHSLLILWLLSVIAIAGPSWEREPSPFLSDEAGLMIVLKNSRTMEAKDVQPSRLAPAKQKIRAIMESRQGGAAGLIVYSGSAHLVMPLTRDTRIINTMLEDMGPELMAFFTGIPAFQLPAIKFENIGRIPGAPYLGQFPVEV